MTFPLKHNFMTFIIPFYCCKGPESELQRERNKGCFPFDLLSILFICLSNRWKALRKLSFIILFPFFWFLTLHSSRDGKKDYTLLSLSSSCLFPTCMVRHTSVLFRVSIIQSHGFCFIFYGNYSCLQHLGRNLRPNLCTYHIIMHA